MMQHESEMEGLPKADLEGTDLGSAVAVMTPEERVIDVTVRLRGPIRSFFSTLGVIAVYIPIVVGAVLLQRRYAPTMPSIAVLFACIVMYSLMLHVVVRFQTWRMRKRLERLATRISDGGDMAQMVYDPVGLVQLLYSTRTWFAALANCIAIASILRQAGYGGVVVRMSHPKQKVTVVPVQEQFELVSLNENDASFVDLHRAYHEMEQAGSREYRPMGTMLRNIRLKSGSIYTTFALLMFLLACYQCYVRWAVDFRLALWGGVLLATLFVPATAGLGLETMQLVPGGLVMRINQKLRLFAAKTSVLLVRQINAHKWTVVVTNGEEIGLSHATTTEVHMLMKAWLSECSPPTQEQIELLVNAA